MAVVVDAVVVGVAVAVMVVFVFVSGKDRAKWWPSQMARPVSSTCV